MDSKAKKILFDCYWKPSSGWKKTPIDFNDFEYAKSKGLMFDPVSFTHDRLIQSVIKTCNNTSKKSVTDAFISSLSNRDLEHRSSLASFACGQKLPLHSHLPNSTNTTFCSICSEYEANGPIDLNILNFERIKFGGVRHLSPLYIWLDLTCFEKFEVRSPTPNDIELLRDIFDSLKDIGSNKLSDAQKALSFLKSNKNEREGIVSTLGYCGILSIPNIKPFHEHYTTGSEREHSTYAKSDWPFPADLWKPEYGFNAESIDYWFGDYLR